MGLEGMAYRNKTEDLVAFSSYFYQVERERKRWGVEGVLGGEGRRV